MNRNRRVAEFRADVKALSEQRADLEAEMTGIIEGAKAETRALSDEEQTEFDGLEKSIMAIDKTINAEKRASALKNTVSVEEKKNNVTNDKEVRAQQEAEERAFCDMIRGTITAEQRADVNMTTTDNGSVIPASIANKIIKKVIDISPIFQLAEKYNVGGTLTIPYVDDATNDITVTYATEFTDLESSSNKFGNIELKGFLAGALTKVSKSLLNNSNFNLLTFIIDHMAENIAKFIEKELLIGTTDKIAGLSGVSQKITAAAATAITADELIDLQEEVPDLYQAGAIWIMNKKTRTAIRKLKDGDGNYLLQRDATAKWGYTLFGKDVYTSANMPAMAAGKTAVYYGEMDGLAVKISEDVSIEVLREKYATQHAIGVVAWFEMDAKVQNKEKIAALVMKATA